MKIEKISFNRIAQDSDKLVSSIRDTGFAIIQHFPQDELIENVYTEWAQFFSGLEKFQYMSQSNHSGYFPFKSENAKGHSVKDLKEFYHLYNSQQLPRGMSSNTLKLKNVLTEAASNILDVLTKPAENHLGQVLDLPNMILGSEQTLLRILHYPPLSEGAEEGAVRAAAHEDINLITVLPAASQPGLEVQDLNGNWHAADCDPGNLLINAGDMLAEATNRFYKSTTHRVVNPIGAEALKSRYSMPLFLHPRPDVRLSERYTAGQYLKERLDEIMGKK